MHCFFPHLRHFHSISSSFEEGKVRRAYSSFIGPSLSEKKSPKWGLNSGQSGQPNCIFLSKKLALLHHQHDMDCEGQSWIWFVLLPLHPISKEGIHRFLYFSMVAYQKWKGKQVSTTAIRGCLFGRLGPFFRPFIKGTSWLSCALCYFCMQSKGFVWYGLTNQQDHPIVLSSYGINERCLNQCPFLIGPVFKRAIEEENLEWFSFTAQDDEYSRFDDGKVCFEDEPLKMVPLRRVSIQPSTLWCRVRFGWMVLNQVCALKSHQTLKSGEWGGFWWSFVVRRWCDDAIRHLSRSSNWSLEWIQR